MDSSDSLSSGARIMKAYAAGWLMQRITGAGLVLFLALHLWVQHMPNGFLATADEYNRIVAEFADRGPVYEEALASGHLREALDGEHVITYSKVAARLQNPWWKAINIMLLLFGVAHGLNGVHNVLRDYVHRGRLRLIVMGFASLGAVWVSVVGIRSLLAVGSGL